MIIAYKTRQKFVDWIAQVLGVESPTMPSTVIRHDMRRVKTIKVDRLVPSMLLSDLGPKHDIRTHIESQAANEIAMALYKGNAIAIIWETNPYTAEQKMTASLDFIM